MKAARIISLIAIGSNIYLSYNSLATHFNLGPIFEIVEAPIPIPWPFIFNLLFLLGSIAYWFYLRIKEKRGENVKFSLLVSILLLLIPILIIISIVALTYTQPIYKELQAM